MIYQCTLLAIILLAFQGPNKIVAQDSVPFMTRDLTVSKTPRGEFVINGNRVHHELTQVNYVVMVPLKFNVTEFEIRSVDILQPLTEKFVVKESNCDVVKPTGERYDRRNLLEYLEKQKCAYAAYSFQKLDATFLSTLSSDCPIFLLKSPTLEEATRNLQLGMGVTGTGPPIFSRNELEKQRKRLTSPKSEIVR